MDEVSELNEQPMSRFQDMCAFKSWLKQKSTTKETIRIRLKGTEGPIELPFRAPVLSVISP